MTPPIQHRAEREPRVTELNEAHTEHAAAIETEANPAEPRPDRRRSLQAEGPACVWNPNERVPPTPKADQSEKESPPESFDVLAARLNERFDKLAADVEEMREGLREAEERGERLRHKLLNNGALRGSAGGRPVSSAP
jgi:hypothetical protein